jgi:hypothetical protein
MWDSGAIPWPRCTGESRLAVWYVYRHEAQHLGPLSTEDVAEAILAGRLAPDVWVAAPGGPRWLRALDVPVISQLIDGLPTRKRGARRDSGLRIVPGIHASTPAGLPQFGSTVMMVNEEELVEVIEIPSTRRHGTPEVPDAPPTEPSAFDPFTTDPAEYGSTPTGEKRGPDGFPLPPSSSSPSPKPSGGYRHGETLESPGYARPKKQSKGA